MSDLVTGSHPTTGGHKGQAYFEPRRLRAVTIK